MADGHGNGGLRTPNAYSLKMTTQLDRFGSRRYFRCGKELVSEDRGLDRILRRLKLHAEGRQFGGQNSRARRAH